MKSEEEHRKQVLANHACQATPGPVMDCINGGVRMLDYHRKIQQMNSGVYITDSEKLTEPPVFGPNVWKVQEEFKKMFQKKGGVL